MKEEKYRLVVSYKKLVDYDTHCGEEDEVTTYTFSETTDSKAIAEADRFLKKLIRKEKGRMIGGLKATLHFVTTTLISEFESRPATPAPKSETPDVLKSTRAKIEL